MSIGHGSKIVTDKLELHLDSPNTRIRRQKTNLLDSHFWNLGTGSDGIYSAIGDANERLLYTNPFGQIRVIWESLNNDTASDADGGWNASVPIDPTKTYRFSVWTNRKVIGNGNFYFGTAGYNASSVNIGVINRLTGVNNTNGYFELNSGWTEWGVANEWYLVVGHVWAQGSGIGATHVDTGVYDTDGNKIYSGTEDFVWNYGTVSTLHRSYLYYSTITTTHQQWYSPRIDVIDGSEPSIHDLIFHVDNHKELSPNAINVSLWGGCHFTGDSYELDGVTGRINLLSSTNFFPAEEFTIETWFRSDGITATSGTSPGLFGATYGVRARLSANSIVFGLYLINKATSVYLFTDEIYDFYNSKWNQAVFTASPFEMKIYVNGELAASQFIDRWSGYPNWVTNLYFGQDVNHPSYYFTGGISNIKMYKKVLSPQEVKQNFNALRGRYGI